MLSRLIWGRSRAAWVSSATVQRLAEFGGSAGGHHLGLLLCAIPPRLARPRQVVQRQPALQAREPSAPDCETTHTRHLHDLALWNLAIGRRPGYGPG
jgi:acetyl esterase/lipase